MQTVHAFLYPEQTGSPKKSIYMIKQIDSLKQNVETIIGEDQLRAKLERGKPLRIKLGVDPTRPDLTFGHMVVFNKLRQFQDYGHQACLIIGDFTTLIGDPSGRSSTRPVLSSEEIQENALTYLDQAFQVLDQKKTQVYYNSEWFGKAGFEDCLKLARKMTVARMLEREDFAQRYASHTPISIIEFLYPLIQGHDSVVLKADVELGGTDQLFNMLVGRQLQKDEGQEEQVVICMPLLVGLDGNKKMSKSMNNFISFNDPAKDMFGKIMSIPDEVMWDYYQLLLEVDAKTLQRHKQEHPMQAKKHLASSLVARFHSLDQAQHELKQFEQVFSRNEQPDDMPEFSWQDLSQDEEILLTALLRQTELFPSTKEIKRLIEQGAVKIDEEKVDQSSLRIRRPHQPIVIQAGKRVFLKIRP